MSEFVVAKRGIPSQGVEIHDIGIIKARTDTHVSVFFIRIWKEVELQTGTFSIIDVDKTGDGFKRKICNVCSKLKNTTEFARNQNAKNNRPVRRPSCQQCRKIIEGKRLSPEESTLWHKEKPHKEPFECPICRKRSIAGVTCKVVLDHDHSTGKARGWICDSCNTGLGRMKDDTELMESAIDYLRRHN